MGKNEFENYMSNQIQRIRSFHRELERELGREVSVDEAARRWIQEYAETFHDQYKKQKTR